MPYVIGVLNQKGGVGKTTLSVNIAAELSRRGKKVLLVDGDPQASAQKWAEERSENESLPHLFDVIGMARKSLRKDLKSIKEIYDFVIVDGAPRVTDLTRGAMMAADFVLIPTQPSIYDVWASEDVVNLLGEVQVMNDDLQAAFVLNRKIPNTRIGDEIGEALKQFEGVSLLETTITQRVIFSATAKGLVVSEVKGGEIASFEIQSLVDEILLKLED